MINPASMVQDPHLAVQARHLSKEFGERNSWRFWRPAVIQQAVDRVSFDVARGELFGLLGPNGAGKTTLVKMLCTLVLPTAGEATVLGLPLSSGRAIRRRVGLTVTDERSFYWRLSGRQNLRFFAGLHGIFGEAAERRIAELLTDVDLLAAADRRFSGYSSGMRQRLSIARALLPRPELLILDEPSRSLDPVATQLLHDLILRLRQERSLTVILITHDLSEAEKLCNRVAVMQKGRLVAQGTPGDIRARLLPAICYTVSLDRAPSELLVTIEKIDPRLKLEQAQNGATITFDAAAGDPLLDQVLTAVHLCGVAVTAVESQTPSLEHAFQRLVGE